MPEAWIVTQEENKILSQVTDKLGQFPYSFPVIFSIDTPFVSANQEEDKLINQLLFGQDSGSFMIKENKEENKNQNMRPYATFFDTFVPYCVKEGIDQEIIYKVITENSKRVLTIK